MYDTLSLVRALSGIGFSAVSRKAFDSDIPDIANVELPERTDHAVIVEGRKLESQTQ
jgi:hypothetical protein